MKRFGHAVAVFVLSIGMVSCDMQNSESASIPAIEKWERDVSVQLVDPLDDPLIQQKNGHFIRWFRDSSGNGYQGMLVYWKDTKDSVPVLIGKSWGFRTIDEGDFDTKKARSALLLENNTWFVGDADEAITFRNKYEEEKVVGTTFRFVGRNSDVSRTFLLH